MWIVGTELLSRNLDRRLWNGVSERFLRVQRGLPRYLVPELLFDLSGLVRRTLMIRRGRVSLARVLNNALRDVLHSDLPRLTICTLEGKPMHRMGVPSRDFLLASFEKLDCHL